MDACQLKPRTQVAIPHDDILRGELEMSTYAAELGNNYEVLDELTQALFIFKPRNVALIISARDMNAAERRRYGRK